MNIIKIMIPKISTVFLHENDTVRQGLERFRAHGYTAIPVLNEEEQYVGSVTEGDFLRHILAVGNTNLKIQERYRIGDIMRKECYLALSIDADEKQVIAVALNQNYVPIVDGRGALCGIITRQSLLFNEKLDAFLANNRRLIDAEIAENSLLIAFDNPMIIDSLMPLLEKFQKQIRIVSSISCLEIQRIYMIS